MAAGTPYSVYAPAAGLGAGQTFSPTTATTAGDVLLLTYNAATDVTGVSDTQGNTWVHLGSDAVDGVGQWYASYKGSPGTPTAALGTSDVITLTGGGSSKTIQVVGCAGLQAQPASVNPAWVHLTGTSESNTLTPASAGDLLIASAAFSVAEATMTWSGGFTKIVDGAASSATPTSSAYQIAASTSALTATMTVPSSGYIGVGVVSFAAAPVTYNRVVATIWSNANTTGAALSVAVSPTNVGDVMVAAVCNQGSGIHVSSLSGGGVTTWTRVGSPWTDPESTPTTMEMWIGTVVTPGAGTVSVTWSGTLGSVFNEITIQDFHPSVPGTWFGESFSNRTNASSGTVTYPAFTARSTEIYFGYASTPSAISTGSPTPAGFTAGLSHNNNCYIYGSNYAQTAVTPTHSVTLSEATWATGMGVYLVPSAQTPAVAGPSLQTLSIPPGRQSPMAFTRTITAINENPPNVPLTIANNAAGGTNGVQTSIANSGGASGTAWDFTTVSGTGAVFQADNTHVPPGHPSPLCYQIATGATAVQCYTGWGSGASGMGAGNWGTMWFRFYLFTGTSIPAATTRLFCAFDPTGQSICAALRHTTGNGFLSTTDSTNSQKGIGALALPANTWMRIEGWFTAGPNGQEHIDLYTTNAEAPLGSTPDDSFTSTASNNLAAMGNARWGQSAGSIANYGPYWFSDVAVSNVGPLGPVGVVSTPVTLVDVAGATEQISQKMADLQDSFPGSSVDATKWNVFNTVSVSGNVLTETSPAGSPAGGVINSVVTNYDLTGSYLLAQLVSAGTQTTLTQALLKVQLDGNNAAQIFVQNGSLACQADIAGTWSGWYASVSYNAAVHKWLRIRESGGTLYFDWSTDGITWTNLYNLASPFALTSLTASIQDTSNTTSEPASSAQWANVNLPPVPITVADVAAGVEAVAVSATVPLAEAGAGVEALTVPAETIPLADAAGGVEALTVAATVPLAERAAGVEAATATATVPLADVAGGTDQVVIAAAVPLADPGAGTEAISIPAETIPLAEAGAAAEAISVSVTLALAENGAAAEAATATVTLSLPDVAGGSEALLSGMPVTYTDAAGAIEAVSVSAAVPVTDAGGAAEAVTLAAVLSVSDQAGAIDAISVTAAVSLAEAGGAADSLGATIAAPLAEAAGAAEALSVSVTLALADQAGSVEYTPISGQVDAAGSIDALAVTAAVPLPEVAGAAENGLAVLHDSAAGAESLSVAATVPLAETAGAADALAVTGAGTPTLADAGGAAEALAVTATLSLPEVAAGADAFTSVQGATPALADVGGAADTLSVTAAAAVSFVDAGAATESAASAVVTPAADAAGAAEGATVTVTLPLPDQSGAAEALGASVSLPAAETAAATDQAQIAVQASAGDRAGAAELFGVSKPVPLAEAAAAADTLAVNVQLSFGPMPTYTPEPVDPVWMAFTETPEWAVEAADARWTAHSQAGEWAASVALPRWEIVMAVFEPIAAVSLENVNARWTSDRDGVVIDPTAQNFPVQFAFPVSSGDENHPAPPVTWYAGVWVTPNGSAKGFLAQCMVGPSGGVVTLTAGQHYDVWCKITTGTEIPAKFVGVQAVY